MSLAKEKLFGKKQSHWPLLQRLVDEGALLSIDLVYAATQTHDEREAATHAALLMMARHGHLALERGKVAEISPKLAELIDESAQLPKYAAFEETIASNVKRLLRAPLKSPSPISAPLTEEQALAVKNAGTFPLSIITGGPGTGKTYTASQIAKATPGKILLTAPTGKAATHLESKVGFGKAATLHSLLRGDPLVADLVIVDECSMIDAKLFAQLLSSITEGTGLVLMGDVDQLPAVEGGSIFADLIDSHTIPTTHLTKCMRSDRLDILNLAAAIQRGEQIELRNLSLGDDLESIYQNLWNHAKGLFDTDFRILSTLRKGPLGVDALNAFFHEKFSSQTDTFPIMIKRNDARSGLSNGDIGTLTKDKGAHFGDRFIPQHELPAFEYAYCISVHKSQGSEYDHVLLLVPEGSEAFGREVLYTAVTRAKSTLEIEGSPAQIAAALSRSSRKVSRLLPLLAL